MTQNTHELSVLDTYLRNVIAFQETEAIKLALMVDKLQPLTEAVKQRDERIAELEAEIETLKGAGNGDTE